VQNDWPPVRSVFMLKSPAKINLGLRVVGRRADGYHLLESLFWPINFQDDIYLEKSALPCVNYQWAEDAPMKGVTLFQEKETLAGKVVYGKSLEDAAPTRVLIKKRIPIGSGLGGVSSNVGTLLKHFRSFLKQNDQSIESQALELGADIPFFLDPRPCWVTGIGEYREPLNLAPEIKTQLFFLLLLFPFASSTPNLFARFREGGSSLSSSIPMDTESLWTLDRLTQFLSKMRNDLEPLAEQEYPDIKIALEVLRPLDPLYCGLSGTGSTCFAIFSSAEKRSKAAKEILPTCRQLSCKTVFAETF